jgi:hypothetical protein
MSITKRTRATAMSIGFAKLYGSIKKKCPRKNWECTSATVIKGSGKGYASTGT